MRREDILFALRTRDRIHAAVDASRVSVDNRAWRNISGDNGPRADECTSADLDSRQVVVEWGEPATWEQIEAMLIEINYPASN